MRPPALFHNNHSEKREDLIQTGVYTIEFINKPGLYYVGSATSYKNTPTNNGFYSRWWSHYNDLSRNKHCNSYLQRIVNKYGIENLRFKILSITEPYLARYEEQYWINMLQSFNEKYGYNMGGHVAVKNVSFKMSQKSSDDKSLRMSHKVLQYDLEGNFIKEFPTKRIAAKETKTTLPSIVHCMFGGTFVGGNFQWRIKKDRDFPIFIGSPPEKKRVNKKVAQYTLDKKLIKIFDSLTEAIKFLGCERPNFIRVLKRRYGASTGNYRGYYWEYCE